MGKCVVADPIACEGIDVVANRNVILASTPEEFAGAISQAMADPSKRSSIGAAARELVTERYTFESIGKALQDVFHACVNSRLSSEGE